MSFSEELRARQAAVQGVETLMPDAKIHAHSIATGIVVGLLAANLEELSPGIQDRMRAQLDAITAHIAQDSGVSPAIAAEVARFAKVMLSTSNT